MSHLDYAAKSFVALIAAVMALASPALAKASGASPAAAEAMVRRLYLDPAPNSSRRAVQRLYAPDLAAAVLRAMDPANPEGLPFDMRYGDEDWKIEGLSFSVAPRPGGCVVIARFDSFGMPREVDWRMVRAPGGWRVFDVTAPDEGDSPGWSLRALLKAAAARSP